MSRGKVYLYQVNVTRDCNLRCTHCYIHSDAKKASGKMTGDNIVDVITGIKEHMEHIGYDHAEIHIIGGEPTMLGVELYREVIPKIRAVLKDVAFSYELMLISNLLNKDIVEIASMFDRVTTSYEPDTRFPKPKLEQKWVEAVNDLQGIGIDVGVTTAITMSVIRHGADKLLDQFMRQGIKKIHFGFFIPEGDGLVHRLSTFPEYHETSQFLIDTGEWYMRHRDDPDLFVNPFESMLSSVASGEPLDDIVCPIIPGSIDINWDGNAATCLEAGGSLDPNWLGNIFETSIKDVTESKGFKKEVRKAMKPQTACMECEYYQTCRSGCGVLFKFWDPKEDKDCPGFKRFIDFVNHQYQNGVMPKYEAYSGLAKTDMGKRA